MIHEISTNIWKLETTPLNNPWVKEEITIRKKIELNAKQQNLWNPVKCLIEENLWYKAFILEEIILNHLEETRKGRENLTQSKQEEGKSKSESRKQ